jgi:hypothetical protein
MKPIIGQANIAKELGIGRDQLRRWIRAGLPIYQPGVGPRARMYAYADELHDWVRAHPVAPVAAAPRATLDTPVERSGKIAVFKRG